MKKTENQAKLNHLQKGTLKTTTKNNERRDKLKA